MTNGWRKLRINEFNIDDIYEDPTTDTDWVEWFQKFCKEKLNFTDEHVELMLNKSKICNWPEKFKSKELLRINKEKFKELIGIRYILEFNTCF